MTEINSRTQGRFRLFGRLPAYCGDLYESELEAEIGLDPQAARAHHFVICDNYADLLFSAIAGPFPRDFGNKQKRARSPAEVRRPGAGHARALSRGTPPNSRGKGALLRYVPRRVVSGYVRHGRNDTRGLSSCLVNSTGSYAIAQKVE